MTYISLFPSITSLGMAGDDLVPIVDVSLGVAPEANKQISYAQFFLGVPRGTGIGFGGGSDRVISPSTGAIAIQAGGQTAATFTPDGISSTWIGEVIAPEYGGTGFNSLAGLAAAIGYGPNWMGNPIEIAKGGTDATTPEEARENLGLKSGNNDLAQLAGVASLGFLFRRDAANPYSATVFEGVAGRTSVGNGDGAAFPTAPVVVDLDPLPDSPAGEYGSATEAIVAVIDEYGRVTEIDVVEIDAVPPGGATGQVLAVTATTPSRMIGWVTPSGGGGGGGGGDSSAGGLAYLSGVTV